MRIKRIHEQKEERDKRTDGVKRVHNEKGGGGDGGVQPCDSSA